MKFTTDELKRVVNLNNEILSNSNLRKQGPLSNLIFVIMNGRLYTITQGQKNISALAMLVDCGETDEPTGVYAINGGNLNKTLAECTGDVELEFVSDDTRHEVVLHADFGKVKFSAYKVETSTADTQFELVIPKLLELRDATLNEGHTISSDEWTKHLDIVGAAGNDVMVSSPFIVSNSAVILNLPYMVMRYRAEMPYRFATEIDIVKVLRRVADSGDGDTFTRITNESNRHQLHLAKDNVYFYVNGVNTQAHAVEDFKWEQEVEQTGMVETSQLQRLLRIADIFTDGVNDVVIDWDFGNNVANVYNMGANLANQQGTNTHLTFNNNSGQEDLVVKTAVHGQTLLKLLSYTSDDEVAVEVLRDKKQLHITFSEGDFYIFYKAL